MRKRLAVLFALPLLFVSLPNTTACPTAVGIDSDNVEYVTYVPF